MERFVFLSFALSFSLGFVSIFLAFRLYTSYPFGFLRLFAYYTLTSVVLGLSHWISRLLLTVTPAASSAWESLLWEIYVFLSWPLIILSMYLFAGFALSFFRQNLSKRLKTVYFVSGGAIMAVLITGQAMLWIRPGYPLLIYTFRILHHLPFLVLFAILVYMILNARRLPEKSKRNAIRDFVALKGGLAVLYYLYTLLVPVSGTRIHVTSFLYFTAQLVPLLYLRSFVHRFYRGNSRLTPVEPGLNDICAEKGISPREKEILELLLAGKSNKEIENELFISIHTVKIHVRSILKKLNVKNRVHLLNKLNGVSTLGQ